MRKTKFVVFGRSNIKFELEILQDISRTRVEYLVRARTPTLPNEAQKFLSYDILRCLNWSTVK